MNLTLHLESFHLVSPSKKQDGTLLLHHSYLHNIVRTGKNTISPSF